MEPLREALRALLGPRTAFADLGTVPPRAGRAFGRMLLWWLPPALLYGALSARNALGEYASLRAGHLPAWLGHLILPGLDPDSSVAFLRSLPAPPAAGTVALAVLLLVPLSVVGIWLVIDAEFIALQGMTQFGFQFEIGLNAFMHGIVKHHVARLAGRLGSVHCRIRITQKFIRMPVMVGAYHNTDAGGGKYIVAVHVEGTRQFLMDVVCYSGGIIQSLDTLQ